jgi:hypothetical protein
MLLWTFNGMRGTLSIYNTLGQTLRNMQTNGNVTLHDLPNGLLTYRFIANNGARYNGKLTVVK